jgi:hypothetical protein
VGWSPIRPLRDYGLSLERSEAKTRLGHDPSKAALAPDLAVRAPILRRELHPHGLPDWLDLPTPLAFEIQGFPKGPVAGLGHLPDHGLYVLRLRVNHREKDNSCRAWIASSRIGSSLMLTPPCKYKAVELAEYKSRAR